MTIGTAGNRVSFNCDGVTTLFPVPLQAYLATDFTVILAAPALAGGGEATLTLNSNYTLSANSTDAPPKWALTTTSTYAAGYTLQVIVNPQQVQQTGYVQGQAFPSLSVQTNLDRLTQMVQRLQDQLNRSIRAPDGDASPVMLLPPAAQRALMNLTTDVNGNLSLSQVLAAGTLSQSTIGSFLYGTQTAAEAAALVTPIAIWLSPGNVNRYGANIVPGTTDMTAAIQAALSQSGQTGGAPAYAPAGTYLASGQITQSSNSRFYGDGSSTIINFPNTANADNFLGTGVSNSSIQSMKLVVTAGPITGGLYAGVVAYRLSTNCKVENVEVVGAYYGGIVLGASSKCRVVGNYIHGAQGTVQDSADIHVDCTATVASTFNVIDGNQCFGGGWHGISVEASVNPNASMSKNVITNNRVSGCQAYGIFTYTHTPFDTYNQIIGNYIENIQGTALAFNSGQGIYVAGMGATTVANNILVNCLVQTAVQFVPGAIAILSGNLGNLSPCTVSGNAIYDTAQGNANGVPIAAILIASAPNGTTVTGNTVSQQNGIISYGIQVLGGNADITITGNTVNINNSLSGTRGIFAYANGANIQNITICGNVVQGCSSRGISLDQTGGFGVNVFSITGNSISGGSSASIPASVASGTQGTVTGNTCNATTVAALNVSAAINVTYSANVLLSTGATAVSTAGSCSGVFDESNVVNGLINNGATGLNVRTRGAAAPAGTAAAVLGDVVYNTAGATPFAWLCTASGTPGTWVGLVLP